MSWKDTLKKIAPVLATAVGGPFGGVAAHVVTKFLGDDVKDEASLQKAIETGDPEVFQKLQTAEKELLIELEKLGIQKQELENADRANARDRQIKTGDWMPNILACLVLTLFGAEMWAIFSGYMPEDEAAKTIAIKGISIIETLLVGAWAYFFGSSVGSKRKTELMKG